MVYRIPWQKAHGQQDRAVLFSGPRAGHGSGHRIHHPALCPDAPGERPRRLVHGISRRLRRDQLTPYPYALNRGDHGSANTFPQPACGQPRQASNSQPRHGSQDRDPAPPCVALPYAANRGDHGRPHSFQMPPAHGGNSTCLFH